VTEKPFDLIHKNLNRQTYIYLRDGRLLTGKMIGYDKELNISLSDVYNEKNEKIYDKLVIRRNNILSIGNDDELVMME